MYKNELYIRFTLLLWFIEESPISSSFRLMYNSLARTITVIYYTVAAATGYSTSPELYIFRKWWEEGGVKKHKF